MGEVGRGGSATLVECIAGTVRDGGARSTVTVKRRKPKLGINSDVAADGAAVVLVDSIPPRTLLRTINAGGHLSGACSSLPNLPEPTWTIDLWAEFRTSFWVYATVDGR
jgi:hypothetical protein